MKVAKASTDPKKYALLYEAPKTASEFTEVLKYTDGAYHTVTVWVTAMEPPTLTSAAIYAPSFKALFILFMIATILESGLPWFSTTFIQLLDARGVKMIILVFFAWFFVEQFERDIVTRLANLYLNVKHLSSFPRVFITALVLAGGSSGVKKLLGGSWIPVDKDGGTGDPKGQTTKLG